MGAAAGDSSVTKRTEDIKLEMQPFTTQEAPAPASSNKSNIWVLLRGIHLAASASLLVILVATLAIGECRVLRIFGLEIWKWFLLMFLVIGGSLVIGLTVNLLFRFLNPKYEEETSSWVEKVAYMLNGLKWSLQVLFCLLFVFAWLLYNGRLIKLPSEDDSARIMNGIFRILLASLVASAILLAKTFFMVLLAYSFIVERSARRIHELFSRQKALEQLWRLSSGNHDDSAMKGGNDKGRGKVMPDLSHYENMLVKKKVRSWTPDKLIEKITGAEIHRCVQYYGDWEKEEESVERAARVAADKLFKRIKEKHMNSCQDKYIYMDDVPREMKENLKKIIPLLDDAEGKRRVRRSEFRKRVVKVYRDRIFLLRTLNGRDEAVRHLNRIMSPIVAVVILTVCLLVMGVLSIHAFLLILAQFVLFNFMFGATLKTAFEAVLFVFVTRPFDVGDECKIDGVQMIVHDMNILTTVFKNDSGEKEYHPNSVLMGKNIINSFGKPDPRECVDFTIQNTEEKIKKLEQLVKSHIETKSKRWVSKPEPSVVSKNREDGTIDVVLKLRHIVNFDNKGDITKHREELVSYLNKIIDDLDIKCYYPPQ